jgi:hypothetical protein
MLPCVGWKASKTPTNIVTDRKTRDKPFDAAKAKPYKLICYGHLSRSWGDYMRNDSDSLGFLFNHPVQIIATRVQNCLGRAKRIEDENMSNTCTENTRENPIGARAACAALGRLLRADGKPISRRTLSKWQTEGLPHRKLGGVTFFMSELVRFVDSKKRGVYL